jgi:Holliday junction resolvase RusA-like endonuclease
MRVSIRIEGSPVPKGRPRFTRYGGIMTPRRTADYEERVAEAWRTQQPDTVFNGMVEIFCYFGTKRHSVKDLDNLEKSVWDGLQKGGAFAVGDSQIYASHASKYPPLDEENVIVVIRDLEKYQYNHK